MACASELLKLLDADGAAKEERVDFGMQARAGPPSLHLQLMEAGCLRNASKAVALDALPVPLIGGVDLEDDMWLVESHYGN